MKGQRYLAPKLLQAAGLLLLFACAVYWGLTGNQSSLFVGAALSLMGLGSVQDIREQVQRERDRLLGKEERPER